MIPLSQPSAAEKNCTVFPTISKIIPVLMFFVCGVLVVMALVSLENAHPDEFHHLRAGEYYVSHWLPPKICDPQTFASYSAYGISYLNYPDVVYFLAGKFFGIIRLVGANPTFGLRLFNIALFFILAVLSLFASNRFLFLFLLVSPQIWYVFSYFNGDALPLFLAFVIAYQFIAPNSTFQKYLYEKKFQISAGGLGTGILFGLLAISKLNYLVFIGFAGVYLLIRLQSVNALDRKEMIKKIGLILTIALAIVIARNAANYWINGLDKEIKVASCAEQLAIAPNKPSHYFLPDSSPYYHLKEKGIPYTAVLSKYEWLRPTFMTTFGVYGYVNIVSPPLYFMLVKYLLVFFLFYIIKAIWENGERKQRLHLVVTAFFMLATVLASVYNSWTVDFQPQGRYLFPIIPMLALLVYDNRKLLNQKIILICLLLFFTLSVYSFLFVGILHFLLS